MGEPRAQKIHGAPKISQCATKTKPTNIHAHLLIKRHNALRTNTYCDRQPAPSRSTALGGNGKIITYYFFDTDIRIFRFRVQNIQKHCFLKALRLPELCFQIQVGHLHHGETQKTLVFKGSAAAPQHTPLKNGFAYHLFSWKKAFLIAKRHRSRRFLRFS